MLEEWIRNIPLERVERIVADTHVRDGRIWTLAKTELLRRQAQARAA